MNARPTPSVGQSWPQIGDIIPNHDGGRPASFDGLVGRTLSLRLSDGRVAQV